MKTSKASAVLGLAFICVLFLAAQVAAGDKLSSKGTIKSYDIPAKTAVVTLEDGQDIVFNIDNKGALDKLDDRLLKGDGVRIRYEVIDGKNIINTSSGLRGTKPGC